jgi:glycosyltransferase involved in cell wall biosynthesis
MSEMVSIIVNCYNGEKYLEKCLASILNQKYKNFEVVLWDNLSTDNSANILEKFKDKRFKYYKSNVHTSLPKARNLALSKAKGRYIAFLDVDDFWEPNKLEIQIKYLKINDADMVFSNFYIINEKRGLKKIYKDKIYSHKIDVDKLFVDYCIGILTVLYDTKKISYVSFNEDYKIINDFDLFVEITSKYKVVGIDLPLANYRIHDKNETKLNFIRYTSELSIWAKRNYKEYKKFANFENLEFLVTYNYFKATLKKSQFLRALLFIKKIFYSYKLRLLYFILNKLK